LTLAYKLTKKTLGRILYFFIIYYSLFIVCEFLDIFGGFQTWSQKERTENCYNWLEHYLKKDYGKDKDYTESLFLNDYTISAAEATQNKYEYIYEQLELGPGKKLLDCGSGICTWIDFCKERGVEVVGLTLSNEQQEVCTKKNIKTYVQDYRQLDEKFVGKFDAITALGSAEHITISSGYYSARQNSYNDFASLFSVLKQYLKPDGKILITVLVQGRPSETFSVYDFAQAYVMERHYGGYYSTSDIISKAITDNDLDLVSTEDYTKDYHWISVAQPDHFGHWWVHWAEDPLDKITYFFRGLFTDPFLLHHWLYYGMDTWMWQFDGYQETPLTDKQVKNAPANLKYFLIHS
jgi:cyclopropane fatty-acyl-phospholipid synthase-like methyltransferase